MENTKGLITLEDGQRIAGVKQVTRGIIGKGISLVYIAVDCDSRISEKVSALCKTRGITVKKMYTQKELGMACSIDVKAAIVGIKK